MKPAQILSGVLKVSEVTEIAQLRKPLYYYRHHANSISCENRVEQILYAKQAIENALVRRGMTNDYELEFQIYAQCSLLKKQSSSTTPLI